MRYETRRPPNPKEMSFEKLQAFAFRWKEHSEGDRKYFLKQLGRYATSKHLHRVDFFRFLRHHVWLRNGKGRTIMYMHFNEYRQTIGFCMYFKNWTLQAYDQIEELLAKGENNIPQNQ